LERPTLIAVAYVIKLCNRSGGTQGEPEGQLWQAALDTLSIAGRDRLGFCDLVKGRQNATVSKLSSWLFKVDPIIDPAPG